MGISVVKLGRKYTYYSKIYSANSQKFNHLNIRQKIILDFNIFYSYLIIFRFPSNEKFSVDLILFEKKEVTLGQKFNKYLAAGNIFDKRNRDNFFT